MKHVFSDNDILQYDCGKDALEQFAHAIFPFLQDNVDDFKPLRSMIAEKAILVEYDYSIHTGLGGFGGCIDAKTWLEQVDTNPQVSKEENDLDAGVKAVFKDFVEQDYVPSEFLLAIWHVTCSGMFNYVMPDLD